MKTKVKKEVTHENYVIIGIIIGAIAGILPTLFGYSINVWQWWVLMPLFFVTLWFVIEVIKYIRKP